MGEYAEERLAFLHPEVFGQAARHHTRSERVAPPIDLGEFKIGALRFRASSNGVIWHLPKGAQFRRGDGVRISRSTISASYVKRGYPRELAEVPCGLGAAVLRAQVWISWIETK